MNKITESEITESIKTKPYKHQLECIDYGIRHNKIFIGDEQGLGKTLESIGIAVYKKKHDGYKHCLIICGVNGLKYNWKDEVEIHSFEQAYILGQYSTKNGIRIGDNKQKLCDLENIDTLPYFIITNIETLRYKVKTGLKVKKHGKLVDEYVYPIVDIINKNSDKINMIVADECHKMRNPESEQGQQFLKTQARTMVALTGTPLLNTPLDLYIILKWLGYEEHSFYQFKMHYCRFGGFGGYEVIGYKHLDQLQNTLDGVMIRRLKKDVLDLPDKIYMPEYIEMSDKQHKIYDEVRSDMLENIDLIRASVNPLSEMIRLRQATGYTGILSSTVKESTKLDRLVELVDDIVQNDEKVLIFSNWTTMTDVIADKLSQYHPMCITGKVSDEERTSCVRRFQHDDEEKILIGTIGAMGTGLTLTAATNVIFIDHPWTAATYDQAVDRCHRIGQNKPITIYNLITKDTIDEKIYSILTKKRELSKMIVDANITNDAPEMIDFLLS